MMGMKNERENSIISKARYFKDDNPWRTSAFVEMDDMLMFLMSRCERPLMSVTSVPSNVTLLPRTSLHNAGALNLTRA
jgi:hypothetical protein